MQLPVYAKVLQQKYAKTNRCTSRKSKRNHPITSLHFALSYACFDQQIPPTILATPSSRTSWILVSLSKRYVTWEKLIKITKCTTCLQRGYVLTAILHRQHADFISVFNIKFEGKHTKDKRGMQLHL